MMETFVSKNAGIVEARQWPSAHPKEFNVGTYETPWASGAFALISADAFRDLNGFDPIYFLYLEDVDLSWRFWLNGYPVLYEPTAVCAHSTGLFSYRPTRFYLEHFFSLRNFLVISYKFFGELGERVALANLSAASLPIDLYRRIVASYMRLKSCIQEYRGECAHSEQIKILGLNLFHELRPQQPPCFAIPGRPRR